MYRFSWLRLCLHGQLSALLFAASGFCVASAQDGFQGLLSDLDGLERQFESPANPSTPMVQRLSILEQRIFGAPRSGSMVERLNSLRSAAKELPSRNNSALPSTGLSGQPANSSAGAYPVPDRRWSAPNLSPYPPSWSPNANPSSQANPPAPLPAVQSAPPTGWVPGVPSQPPPAASAASAAVIRKNFSPDALPLLNAFPPNLLRMEPDNTALIARPDYYNEVLKASKGKAIRYKTMPIAVYVQPYPDRAFMNCVVKAFESWEYRTGGTVRFSQTDNPNQARIQVVWKHLGGNKDAQGCLLGAHTILKYTNHGSGSLSLMSVGAVPVPIYIPRMGPKYTVPPQVMEVNLDLINTKQPAVKYPCLQNIVTHELGHALGLLGHSPNQADIMYPVTDEHSRLSERDLNTLKKLYEQKCDLPL